MQQKWDQGTLGTQRTTLIGSRTHLGPSMDPTMVLQYTKHGPLYIGSIFAFYATKMESRDPGGTKVDPLWVQDPPWFFNGPCHGPTIRPTWYFINWQYFCILYHKNGIKEVCRHKGLPSLGLGPTMVLQWTLPLAFNPPNMALQYTQHGPFYICFIFAFYASKMGSRDSRDRKVNPN